VTTPPTAVRGEAPRTIAAPPPGDGAADGARPRLAHLRPLDGLRGVAVLAVVVFHFSPDVAPGGFLGVDVFFVLSGFLITSLLVTEHAGTGRIALGHFWVRRARRLFPALLLVLVAVGLYAVVQADPLEIDRYRNDGLATLFYVANWRFISSGQSYIEQFVGTGPSPLRHTWSLAIEEQYYLIWPLVVAGLGVWCVRRRARRSAAPSLRVVIIVGCVVLALASTILMALLFDPGGDPSRVYYGTDTRAHLLLVGSALGAATAGVLALGARVSQRWLVVAGGAGALVLTTLFFTVDATDDWLYRGGYLAFGLLVALLILAAGQPGRNPLAGLLGARPLVGLGLISYGVYLWHWPIFVWVDEANTGLDGVALFALRSVLTLAVSLASYYLVEMPVRRGELRKLGPAVPWIVTPVAVALAVLVLVAPTWVVSTEGPAEAGAPPSASTDEITAEYAAAARCDAPPTTSERATDRGDVLLVGNSYTEEMVPCLGAILEARGYSVDAFSNSGAALCDLLPRLEDDPSRRPDAVVLYFFPVSFRECTDGLEGDALVNRWARDVRRAARLFRTRGAEVFLVPPMPPALSGGEDPLAPKYRAIARDNPKHTRVIDAGLFLRDGDGTYQYRMPCIEGGEPGCDPDGTAVVRYQLDGGKHTCIEPDQTRRGRKCPAEHAAGARRASAALADQILPVLRPRDPAGYD
jgi:peptidoglycan/LPS O-acetylase OafA/YrhL